MKFKTKVRICIAVVAVLAFAFMQAGVMIYLPPEAFGLSTIGAVLIGLSGGTAWGSLPTFLHRNNHTWERGILFMECFECDAYRLENDYDYTT